MTACLVLLAASGCGGGGGNDPAPDLVAQDFQFNPSPVRATGGQQLTLRFANAGTVTHNLSVPSLSIDVDVAPGTTKTIIFVPPVSPGAIEFFCKFHRDQGMTGTFQVS